MFSMKLVAQSIKRLFLDRVSLISKIFVGSNPMRGSRNLTRERPNFNHCEEVKATLFEIAH